MALDLKAIIVVIMYAVASNLFFILLSHHAGICDNLPDTVYFDENIENITDDIETKTSAITFINILLNRCDDFPSWIYWLFQVPTIIGLLYVIRGFLGLT